MGFCVNQTIDMIRYGAAYIKYTIGVQDLI